MAASTLSSGTEAVPYMPMTVQAIPCPAPVLADAFDGCRIPGGRELWEDGGFYSPGECFVGYRALCTQTAALSNSWPIRKDETVVRCIPLGYQCNDQARDQRYATTDFDGTILSAPAFEIRWRSQDLDMGGAADHLSSGVPTLEPVSGDSPTPGQGSSSPHLTSEASNPSASPGASFVLSPGSVAGIVVGSCLGILAVISTIVFTLLRRRRKYTGPARLTEDPWSLQGSYGGLPVELEVKPVEPRELSAGSQPRTANHYQGQDAFGSRIPHIPVNVTPVEVAADPVTAY